MLSIPWPRVEHREDARGWEVRKGDAPLRKMKVHQEPLEIEKVLDSRPDALQYAELLRRCGRERALFQGMRVHAHLVKNSYDNDLVLSNLVVQMYGKCGTVQDARHTFDRIKKPNVFSWNIMLAAYAQNGHPKEALALFEQMKLQHCRPTQVTIVTLLRACTSMGALREGKLLHANAIVSGLESNTMVAGALVTMYGKCGCVEDAKAVFEKLHERDVISWNSMISAYARNGHYREALELFRRAECVVEPDAGTFVAVLEACGGLYSAEEGRNVHALMVSRGVLDSNVVASTALLTMYGKCGCLNEARGVFNQMKVRNLITWTIMIEAYTQHGRHSEAVDLYKMMQSERIRIDKVVLTIVLGAISALKDITLGKTVHAHIKRSSFKIDALVAAALIDMYASCEMLQAAKAWVSKQAHVFYWNALITTYTDHGHTTEALEVYANLPKSVRPDTGTFASILNTCSCIGAAALVEGRAIHNRIIAMSFDSDVTIASALINMYSKCGSLLDARNIFDENRRNNVVFWSSMIAGYARRGQSREALLLLQEMCQLGLTPNRLTFESVLQAAGPPLEQAWWHFVSMVQDHGVLPNYEHYARIVHLLSYAGKLEEAEELLRTMPFEPEAGAWTTLLRACRIHSNPQIRKLVSEEILQLGKRYAELGMWNQVAEFRKVIQQDVEDEEQHIVKSKPVKKSSSKGKLVLRPPSYRPV